MVEVCETLRKKQKVEQWQLRVRHSVQSNLKTFWKKKLKVDGDYIKNTEKLLTTYQDVLFWQRMNTA